MKRPVYGLGRALQLFSLLALPSAVWAAEFHHSEAMSVGIFAASLLAFGAGYFLTQLAAKL